MKRILLILALAAMAILPAAAQKKAKFEFKEDRHNFGVFQRKDATQHCTFEFKNVGDAPLTIQRMTATCTCVEMEGPKKPVQPGKKGVIKVTYHGEKKQAGPFHKMITIISNAEQDLYRLHVEGKMEE